MQHVPKVSLHAAQRWQERVDPMCSALQSYHRLVHFLSHGRRRPTPRHWTRVDPHCGLSFVYWAGAPDVCALVRQGTVITIVTRALFLGQSPAGRHMRHLPCRVCPGCKEQPDQQLAGENGTTARAAMATAPQQIGCDQQELLESIARVNRLRKPFGGCIHFH
jgi:hypothetical protein